MNNPSQVMEYKCPCCGGAIEFNSSIQKMQCPYCDSELEVAALRELDEALKEQQEDRMDWDTKPQTQWQEGEQESLNSYICQSCGGEIVCEGTPEEVFERSQNEHLNRFLNSGSV